MKNVNYLTHCT